MHESLKAAHQRPEGRLIEQALSEQGVSRRGLAEGIGLSEGRVRQIINGYKTEGGQVIPIEAPTETIVRIAQELHLEASELAAAGREDVAQVLRERPRAGVTEEGDVWFMDNSHEIDLLVAWVAAKDPDTPPPADALMLWNVEQLLEAAARRHREEIEFWSALHQSARRSAQVIPLRPDVDDALEDEAAYTGEPDDEPGKE